MSTRALVGYYTGPQDWRAVWVHYDGYPEGPGGLGAKLLRAVRLCGGDPKPVLDHLFSTMSWTSWPNKPHHPDGEDLPIFTPANVFYDFHWYYLFDVTARRLDLIPEGPAMEPQQSVALDDPGEPWGPCALTLADLAPVAGHFHRVALPAHVPALEALLAELAGDAPIVGIDTSSHRRLLELPGRRVHLSTGSGLGHRVHVGDDERQMPPPAEWLAARPALAAELARVLELDLGEVRSYLDLFGPAWARAVPLAGLDGGVDRPLVAVALAARGGWRDAVLHPESPQAAAARVLARAAADGWDAALQDAGLGKATGSSPVDWVLVVDPRAGTLAPHYLPDHASLAPATVEHHPDWLAAWPDPYRAFPEAPAGPPEDVLAALRAVRLVLFDEALVAWARAALERVAIVPYPCAVARIPASPFARTATRVWAAGVEWVVPDRVAPSPQKRRVEADSGAFLWASTNAPHWDDDVAAALVLANAAMRELLPGLDVEVRFEAGRFEHIWWRTVVPDGAAAGPNDIELGETGLVLEVGDAHGAFLDGTHEGRWLAVVLRWFGSPGR